MSLQSLECCKLHVNSDSRIASMLNRSCDMMLYMSHNTLSHSLCTLINKYDEKV